MADDNIPGDWWTRTSPAQGEDEYTGYEVNRQGADVTMILSNESGVFRVLMFSPEDAMQLGLALCHAANDEEI